MDSLIQFPAVLAFGFVAIFSTNDMVILLVGGPWE